MADETSTLLVKHLPIELNEEDRVELLKYFGADHVKCIGTKGHLKHVVFASYKNQEEAKNALVRLHQLEILGKKISVEFSKKQFSSLHPSLLDKDVKRSDDKVIPKSTVKETVNEKEIADNIDQLAPKWGVAYPLNPKLQYIYPAPSVNILTNIANALATVPKFYVQVLHLMNKMNLPAPFGAVTPTPPLPENYTEAKNTKHFMKDEGDVLEESKMDVSSSEESELESDEDDDTHKVKTIITKKRPRKDSEQNKPRKKNKIQKIKSAPKVISTINPGEVFELPQSGGSKKVQFNLSTAIAGALESHEQHISQDTFQDDCSNAYSETAPPLPEEVPPLPEEVPQPPLPTQPQPFPQDLLSFVESQSVVVEEGGFGKIEPQAPPVEEKDEEEPEGWGPTEFISERKLSKGRLSQGELKELSVFKKYNPGEPSSRLYIKNVHKKVNETDLHHIYGKYVDWNKEIEKNMFDIVLLKEGRMKGQAFVTLPNENVAKKAVKDTNAYVLQDKPLVVQFARSTKPKDNPEDSKKKKK